MTKPFRWSLSKREQLGSWPDCAIDPVIPTEEFLNHLRQAAARILAMSDGADLAFIGRTPENFFDYLSGMFSDLKAVPQLHLVQYSLRWAEGGVSHIAKNKRDALFEYFCAEGIDPASIATNNRPLALVDFIASGGTMETLVRLLKLQAEQTHVDWNAVQRRLKIIGLTMRRKNSPNTHRWQQKQNWLNIVPDMTIKNVAMEWDFILPLANTRPKTTRPHHPDRWGVSEGRQTTPSQDQLEALALAVHLYDLGKTKSERIALAAIISQTHQIRQPATRALVTALKR